MLKDNVLDLLRESEDYISGQIIAEKLGVSRMAVSNAVSALKADGFDIEAVTRRGYRLTGAPDRLDSIGLGAFLPAER
nr:HTH domain-containing protein [Lachnospiraceae bacterium]